MDWALVLSQWQYPDWTASSLPYRILVEVPSVDIGKRPSDSLTPSVELDLPLLRLPHSASTSGGIWKRFRSFATILQQERLGQLAKHPVSAVGSVSKAESVRWAESSACLIRASHLRLLRF